MKSSSLKTALALAVLVAVAGGWVPEAGAINCCFCPACGIFPAECSTNNPGSNTQGLCADHCSGGMGCPSTFSASGSCASGTGPCMEDPPTQTPTITQTPTVTETPTQTPTITETPTVTPTLLPLGAVCTSGAECASTFCATGVCCNSACDGPDEACNEAGICQGPPAAVAAPATSHTGLALIGVMLIAIGIWRGLRDHSARS